MINDNDEVQWAYLLDPTFELVNTAGKPLTDGYIEVYIHGTRSKYYCASDFDGTLHPFKIPLDSLGANIVLASPAHAYDVYAYNKFGNLVMSRYNVVPATGDGTVIKDVVTITSNDGTVDVNTSDQTNWDLSIKDTVDRIDEHDIVLTELATAIDTINTDLSTKKDKQSQKSFTGSQTKTITSITQNQQGVISVTYEDIDLPPEVPNVEITSPNGTIDVHSSTDVQTNTKTFTIDVNSEDVKYWRGKTSNFTLNRGHSGQDLHSILGGSGNLTPNNLSAGLYLVTASFDVYPSNVTNELLQFSYILQQDKGTYEIDCSIPEDSQSNKFSYEHVEISNIINIAAGYPTPTLYFGLNFPTTTNNTLNFICHNFAIFKLDNYIIAGGSGSGSLDKVYHDATLSGDGTSDNPLSVVASGTDYTATAPLYINNDDIRLDYVAPFVNSSGKLGISLNGALEINEASLGVKVNPSSGIDIVNDELVVKVGEGLALDPSSGVIVIDSDVSDVVETVEKLKKDLDTQITTNFDMPNISQVYDFADSTNWITANGACMLYQAFTIPINHEVRTVTDDADTPTLLGIYAQQSFGHKIMLALYEYQYAAAGEEHGSSTYVGDTGPVNVLQGVNEYPLKNRNPSITELRSDRVYYAALYLPSTAFVNGLYLAGCPSYGNQSVPAEPRLSCATENITWENQELDMDDPTTTLNHYQVIEIPGQDPYYQYYIGPWVGGYNERWSSPRFYMQIRNGEYNEPVIPTAPFVDLGDNKLPRGGILAGNLPNFTASSSNSGFRDITPLTNVIITAFEWIDNSATANGWEASNCIFTSDYGTNLSGASNTVTDLGQVYTDGTYIAYAHRITFTTPINLTANTTYRLLCSSWANSSAWIWSWVDPTDNFDACNNGWWVDWSSNVTRYAHQAGQYNKIYDNQNNHYVI